MDDFSDFCSTLKCFRALVAAALAVVVAVALAVVAAVAVALALAQWSELPPSLDVMFLSLSFA